MLILNSYNITKIGSIYNLTKNITIIIKCISNKLFFLQNKIKTYPKTNVIGKITQHLNALLNILESMSAIIQKPTKIGIKNKLKITILFLFNRNI